MRGWASNRTPHAAARRTRHATRRTPHGAHAHPSLDTAAHSALAASLAESLGARLSPQRLSPRPRAHPSRASRSPPASGPSLPGPMAQTRSPFDSSRHPDTSAFAKVPISPTWTLSSKARLATGSVGACGKAGLRMARNLPPGPWSSRARNANKAAGSQHAMGTPPASHRDSNTGHGAIVK